MAWYNEFDPRAAAWLQSLADGLTPDQLQSFDPKTYQIPGNATSLQESEDGHSPLELQESPTMLTHGQQVSPANRSALPAVGKRTTTKETSFQSSIGLCESSDLQSSLENRLRQRMDLNGSPEYTLRWKQKAISSGLVICQLRASARHTSVKDSSGVRGYPTLVSQYYQLGRLTNTGRSLGEDALNLMGYATPTASAGQGSHGGENTGRDIRNDAALMTHGNLKSSVGQTGPRGALNPDFCRWLMGFPKEWVSYGVLAMQSYRASQRPSSKNSLEPAGTSPEKVAS